MLFTHARIQQTSTTEGTGDYTLAGSPPDGYNAFSALVTPGADAIFPYLAIDEATAEFELGIGRLSASNTLVRVRVNENSNGSDGAINWAAGTRKIFLAPSATQFPGRNVFVSTALPEQSDNYALGFGQGSLWYTTPVGDTRRLYVCVNPGKPSSPNADWKLVSGIVDMYNAAQDTLSKGSVALGVEDDYVASGAVQGVVGVGMGGEAQNNVSLIHGHGYSGGNYGSHQTERFGMTLVTEDATPALLVNESASGTENRTYIPIPPDSTQAVEGWIVSHIAGGTSKVWHFEFGVQRVGTGNPALLAAATVTAKFGTTGTAPAVAVNTTVDGIEVTFTGTATDIQTTLSATAVTAGARA